MKKILLISGKIDSGKNVFAKFLYDEFVSRDITVSQDLYAADLKDYAREDFTVLRHVLENISTELKASLGVFVQSNDYISSEMHNHFISIIDKLSFSGKSFYEDKTDITRTLLQIYGTDIVKNRFDNKYWIKSLSNRINNSENDVIIITDVRFPDEIDDISSFLKDSYTIPVRIERDIDRNSVEHTHISETSLDDYQYWEYIIDNNGSLDDFKDSAKLLVNDILHM